MLPGWSEWGDWDAGDKSCGRIIVTRSRLCERGEMGDAGCRGVHTETKIIDQPACDS